MTAGGATRLQRIRGESTGRGKGGRAAESGAHSRLLGGRALHRVADQDIPRRCHEQLPHAAHQGAWAGDGGGEAGSVVKKDVPVHGRYLNEDFCTI